MHLKRLLAPKFWKISKKAYKWVVRPRGPHKLEEAIPLLIVLRDILRIAENAKETKKIITRGEVYVDRKIQKDHKYGIGVFDVISIPKLGKNYRVIPTHNGYKLKEISEEEAKTKICKIIGKKTLKNSKTQLNLHDGKNLIVEKDVYKIGDSLRISLPEIKIEEHIKLEKGSFGIAIKGKNIGTIGMIKDIIITRTKEPTKILVQTEERELEILKDHFLVTGKEKSI